MVSYIVNVLQHKTKTTIAGDENEMQCLSPFLFGNGLFIKIKNERARKDVQHSPRNTHVLYPVLKLYTRLR